jgi:hypothetical protein
MPEKIPILLAATCEDESHASTRVEAYKHPGNTSELRLKKKDARRLYYLDSPRNPMPEKIPILLAATCEDESHASTRVEASWSYLM